MYMALAQVFEAIAGPDAPVEFKAYDGSSAGIPGSPVKITVRSPVAVSYLAQAPGALGLARAYVSGHLDVDGNMFAALSRLSKAQDSSISWGDRIKLLQDLGGPKVLFPRIAPPPQEEVPDRRRFTIGATRSTSGSSARAWRTPAPATRPRPPRLKRRRSTSTTWSPASSTSSPACGCSTSAAAGAAWSGTPPRTTASRRSA